MKVREIIDGCALWKPSQDYDTAKPLVSVLLPTFRRAKSGLFEESVQSVLNQSLKDLELIIIDDASTDGTEDLIQHFMKRDPRVSCIRHRYNVGLPAISEYEGYMKARGEYIAFIFDDNVWEQDYLASTINFMVRNKAKASYGRIWSYYGKHGEYMEMGSIANDYGIHMLPYTNHIGNGGVILAREVVETVGLYDPHVTMTRLCDWGLWKRLVKKYKFFGTGIFTGTEKGATQGDSLGNSYKMNHWAVAERESQITDEMLQPRNFEDIDINATAPCSSEYYCEATDAHYRFFENKKWFIPAKQSISKERPLRVCVLGMDYDATMGLSFLRMQNAARKTVFLCGNLNTPMHEIVQSDAVILVRNVIAFDQIKRTCNELKIPVFLYMDDNFFVLADDYPDDALLQGFKKMQSVKNLNKFDGIFTSTQALTEAYVETGADVSVVTLPPCIGEIRTHNLCQDEDVCVFAYMGGKFRDESFETIVMPAICRLSKERKVKIICPSRIDINGYESCAGLEIVQIPYALSLEETLLSYSIHKPHFLLHCGPKLKNNIYKTENAMINATQMGSVLIASEGSNFAEQDGICCVCAENTVKAWYEAVADLISNTEKTQRLYRNAYQHCMDRYDSLKISGILENALSDLERPNMFELIQRTERIGNQAVSNTTVANGCRSLGKTPLYFIGGLKGKRKYRIACHTDDFSELGICFATEGNARGKVKVEIYEGRKLIRESSLRMEDLIWNNWNYFAFEPIDYARDKVFDLVITFMHEDGSTDIGVFEEVSKHTILYRLLNKFGIRLQIINQLYVDCR